MRRTDALIAGGGPAGSAVAIRLARAGAAPLLIERSREPQPIVCGGFLGWDALAALRALGVEPERLGARPITHLRILAGGRQIEARLPHLAAGLSRYRLDSHLIDLAARHGARIERGLAIRRAAGRMLHLADGATIEADALFLATGKHDLRGLARPRRAAGADPAVGLRWSLAATPALARALAGRIELHLFDRGYAGLLLQEDDRVNLCLSVAASRLAEAGGPGGLIAHLAQEAPLLAERQEQAGAADRWLAVAGIPYGWRAGEGESGLFRIGDQAAVIASLAGDGIAIALASGAHAATAWLRDGAAGAMPFQRSFARRAARPIAIAGVLKGLAERPAVAPPILSLIGAMPGLTALLARLTRIGY
ncbi:monooxygenase [Sphingomonas oleivorans]|uniref:Monooxygenase n=1 Tax=Sphingomonas oleivorans TaxID=1735121 RepID=A0A2T5G2S0_9SPHN|nr:FAD-dependent monooxygenase [Sphingomonas oleivorans]PTQ13436.1 monooxygenase [Sphingomonas oleivorans]